MSRLKEGSRKPGRRRGAAPALPGSGALPTVGLYSSPAALGRGQKPACFPKFTTGQWTSSQPRALRSVVALHNSAKSLQAGALGRMGGSAEDASLRPAFPDNSLLHHLLLGDQQRQKNNPALQLKTCQRLVKLWESSAWLWWEVWSKIRADPCFTHPPSRHCAQLQTEWEICCGKLVKKMGNLGLPREHVWAGSVGFPVTAPVPTAAAVAAQPGKLSQVKHWVHVQHRINQLLGEV